MKLRILQLINSLCQGGAENNLVNLVRNIEPERYEFHVAYAYGDIYEDVLRNAGIKLFRFHDGRPRVNSFHSVPIIHRLRGYIRRNKIRIVHTHNYSAHVWGVLAAKLAGAKVLEHVHDPRYEPADVFQKRGMPITKQFAQARYFGRLSDMIVVLTKMNYDFVVQNNIKPPDKVKLLPNGIDLNENMNIQPDDVRSRYDLPKNCFFVLTAMRLSAEKNARMIIEIADHFKDRDDVMFLVAGDGPQREELENAVSARKFNKIVRFLGYCDDVPSLMKITDVFILPTLRELHSLTMIEAMRERVPVLVSIGAGCNDDFINHAVNGFLLDPLDPKPWVETLEKLMVDEPLRQTVGQKGRQTVEEQCDIRHTASTIDGYYRELIEL